MAEEAEKNIKMTGNFGLAFFIALGLVAAGVFVSTSIDDYTKAVKEASTTPEIKISLTNDFSDALREEMSAYDGIAKIIEEKTGRKPKLTVNVTPMPK